MSTEQEDQEARAEALATLAYLDTLHRLTDLLRKVRKAEAPDQPRGTYYMWEVTQ